MTGSLGPEAPQKRDTYSAPRRALVDAVAATYNAGGHWRAAHLEVIDQPLASVPDDYEHVDLWMRARIPKGAPRGVGGVPQIRPVNKDAVDYELAREYLNAAQPSPQAARGQPSRAALHNVALAIKVAYLADIERRPLTGRVRDPPPPPVVGPEQCFRCCRPWSWGIFDDGGQWIGAYDCAACGYRQSADVALKLATGQARREGRRIREPDDGSEWRWTVDGSVAEELACGLARLRTRTVDTGPVAWELADALLVDGDQARSRTVERWRADGRRAASDLGWWPWCLPAGGKLPKGWRRDPRFERALEDWARELLP